MDGNGVQGNVDWFAQWRALFPRARCTPRRWISYFGVRIEDVDYIWVRYSRVCRLFRPKHLLLILNFLKSNAVTSELATRFEMAESSVRAILWPGLRALAQHMNEVLLLSAADTYCSFRSTSQIVISILREVGWRLRGWCLTPRSVPFNDPKKMEMIGIQESKSVIQ